MMRRLVFTLATACASVIATGGASAIQLSVQKNPKSTRDAVGTRDTSPTSWLPPWVHNMCRVGLLALVATAQVGVASARPADTAALSESSVTPLGNSSHPVVPNLDSRQLFENFDSAPGNSSAQSLEGVAWIRQLDEDANGGDQDTGTECETCECLLQDIVQDSSCHCGRQYTDMGDGDSVIILDTGTTIGRGFKWVPREDSAPDINHTYQLELLKESSGPDFQCFRCDCAGQPANETPWFIVYGYNQGGLRPVPLSWWEPMTTTPGDRYSGPGDKFYLADTQFQCERAGVATVPKLLGDMSDFFEEHMPGFEESLLGSGSNSRTMTLSEFYDSFKEYLVGYSSLPALFRLEVWRGESFTKGWFESENREWFKRRRLQVAGEIWSSRVIVSRSGQEEQPLEFTKTKRIHNKNKRIP